MYLCIYVFATAAMCVCVCVCVLYMYGCGRGYSRWPCSFRIIHFTLLSLHI